MKRISDRSIHTFEIAKMSEHDQSVLASYLAEEGFSDAEIESVLGRVRDYDRRMMRDVLFTEIGDGDFDLTSVVEQCLTEA